MANGQNPRMAGRIRKRSRKRRPNSNKNIILPVLLSVFVVFISMLLIAAELNSTLVMLFCMLSLSAIFYFMFMNPSRKRSKRKKRPPRSQKPRDSDPQFYTALPSSLGVADESYEAPKAQVKLPPRPIKAARRKKDYVSYPIAIGSGDYSDSYIRIGSDEVLRLRTEMVPASGSSFLPGFRLDALPALTSSPVEASPVEASPVVKQTPNNGEEEEMEFDMEWD